jgi:hypothetical protein
MFWWKVWREKRDEVAGILGPNTLFTGTSTQFLANLHSKFECPPIMKIVFTEITKNFYIGRIWSCIEIFEERARKPFQLQGALRVWLWFGILTKVVSVN